MRFDVLTLFPQMFDAVMGDSIIGRAQNAGYINVNAVDIRAFSKNKHRKTDDYPYSGGGGMVMTPQPIYDAYKSVAEGCAKKPYTIYMSPQGTVFNQSVARRLSNEDHIVILCGHYEGVDQRVLDLIVDEEISIGDYVLTGGEIPAMAVIDSVSRMVEGVLAGEASYTNESHFNGLLEHPQYTRPPVFEGLSVPEILLSGDHAKIDAWKLQQSIEVTRKKRPDMLENKSIGDID